MTRGAQLLKLTKEEKAAREAGSSGAVRLLKAVLGTVAAKLQTAKKKKTHTHRRKIAPFPSQVSRRRIDLSYLAGEREE